MPTLFQMPAGERVSITTGEVHLDVPGVKRGMLKTNVTYWATATDEFQKDWLGRWRRLFVDVSEDFGAGLRTIWLENDVDEPPPFIQQQEEEMAEEVSVV